MAAAAAVAASRAAGTERMREHLTADRISIFSFELNKDDFDPSLEKQIAFVNQRLILFRTIEENSIKPLLITLQTIKKQLSDKFLELETLINSTAPESKITIDIIILIEHINFMTSYLMLRFGSPPDLDGMKILENMEILSSSALYWYKAHAIFFIHDQENSYTNAIFKNLITCLEKVPNTNKEMLAIMISKRFEKCREYLDASLLAEICKADPRLIELNLTETPTINARHEHTMRALAKLPHADFFNAYQTNFVNTLNKKDDKNIRIARLSLGKAFPKYVPSELFCNQYDLLKFVAHLGMISDMSLSFEAENLPKNDALDSHITEGLMNHGFLNSEAMIIEDKIFKKNAAGETIVAPEFIEQLKNLYASFSLPGIAIPKISNDQIDLYCRQIITSYKEHKKRKSDLGKFKELNALFLFRQTLLSIPNPYPVEGANLSRENLNQVISLVDDCFELSAMANKKIKSKTTMDLKEHEALFTEAKKIAQQLRITPKNLILQTGTPILTGSQSEHAFYILIEFEETAGTPSFHINIFNGGPGLEYHHPYAGLAASEFAKKRYGMYHAVASKSFPLNDETELFLQHYLYKTLSLPHCHCNGDETLQQEMLKNIYLGEKDDITHTFRGYGAYTLADAFHKPTDITYRAQLSENCTIFNLKKALQIAAKLSDTEAGDLENLLLYGAQKLLENALTPSAAASGGAAGGAGARTDEHPGSGSTFGAEDEEAAPLIGLEIEEEDRPASVTPLHDAAKETSPACTGATLAT